MERSTLSNFILPLDNEGVESIRFIDSFRDPLQRTLENGYAQDDQDGELVETMEELKPNTGIWMKKNLKTLEN